ncbi:conserved hypothetical protein [Desulfarculales bacterium]
MDNIDKIQLRERTRRRNQSMFTRCSFGGIMSPVDGRQDALNLLAQSGIENLMAISDETWEIKELHRDKTNELEHFAVNQDRQIADAKGSLERAKLALKMATDTLQLAVLRRDAAVKSLLMDARQYASVVELEQLDVERQKAILAVTKEGLHLKQVNGQIFLEYINKKMVEVDIAKHKVEAAKANVRAILADIEAGEAEIKLLNAQIEAIMMEAEKAGLQAEVATIFAQIMVKQLSQVKLAVHRAEITAGFAYIASRLEDMAAIYGVKNIVEQMKIELEQALREELFRYLTAEEAAEYLKEVEQLSQREIFEYTVARTLEIIRREKSLKRTLVHAKLALADMRLTMKTQEDLKRTWAQDLLNDSHKWVYMHGKQWFTDVTRSTEYIKGE